MIKNLIKKIDELLFKGIVKRSYHRLIYFNDVLKKTKQLNYTLRRKEKKSLLLADLIYRSPLDGVIVECGVGVGATLIKIAQISKKKIFNEIRFLENYVKEGIGRFVLIVRTCGFTYL